MLGCRGRVLALVMALAGNAALACAPAPEPVLTLATPSRYIDGDPTRSLIDEAAKADAVEDLAPLDDFLRELAREADVILATAPADRAALATCLVARMAVWADADALSGLKTETARLTIGSRLAGFAMVLRVARPYADPADLAPVQAWLTRRMLEQQIFWETAADGSARGNLRAWAALAGAALADVSDDPILRGWAAWSATYVLCTAAEDGSLPQEMRRGRLALHYQLHALSPLVTTAALLAPHGMDLMAVCNRALPRTAMFTLTDLVDGAATRAITGEVQSLFDGSDPLAAFQLAWVEAYLSLVDDPDAETRIAPLRPLSFSKLGGNQTLLWRGAP